MSISPLYPRRPRHPLLTATGVMTCDVCALELMHTRSAVGTHAVLITPRAIELPKLGPTVRGQLAPTATDLTRALS
jgi:hypothetical protein